MINSVCPNCTRSHFVDIGEWASDFERFVPRESGFFKLWCPECISKDPRKYVVKIPRKPPAKTPEDVWRDICPVEYRTEQEGGFTDEERLHREFRFTNRYKGKEAKIDWELKYLTHHDINTESGIVIAGPPGAMKTRAAWRMARESFNKGSTMHPFTCWSFQAAAQKAAGEYRSEEWLKSLLSGFILIDDLGKSPWTDYTAATFFELVEQVVAHHGKLVITANDSSVELAESIGQRKTISPEIGAGILRRIREHFLRVVAVKPNTP